MKPVTAEWVDKAEGDWNAARQLNRVRKDPNYDGVCFHCQQCIEKYLKGRLVEAGVKFTKTHDLLMLLNLVLPIEPTWLVLSPRLNALNHFSVLYRYPGYDATKTDAKQVITECREVRRTIRFSLGLPV